MAATHSTFLPLTARGIAWTSTLPPSVRALPISADMHEFSADRIKDVISARDQSHRSADRHPASILSRTGLRQGPPPVPRDIHGCLDQLTISEAKDLAPILFRKSRGRLCLWLLRHRDRSGNSSGPLRTALRRAFGDETCISVSCTSRRSDRAVPAGDIAS